MKLSIELGVLTLTLLGAAGFFLLSDSPLEEQKTVAVSQFTHGDYAVFDRNFEVSGVPCQVGMKDHRMCFGRSPLQNQIVVGEPLPARAPAISAEFRVIVETSLKTPDLQTVRYGATLALIDPETRIVKDVLHLSAPDYVSARDQLVEPNA